MELFFQDLSSWLQGVLFILVAYHTTSYVFTKDKSFAIYACYLILVTVYLIPKTENDSSTFISQKLASFFNAFNWIIQIWYWMLYAWFSIYFLNLKEKNIDLAVKIMLFILVNTICSTLFFIIDFFIFDHLYMGRYFIFAFTPVSLIILSFFLKAIYQHKDKINTFFVFGLIFFVSFSVLALYFSFAKYYPFTTLDPIAFFMIGVLLEAVTLSIGLGYKYHLYRKERDDYNSLLISELRKNDALKDQLNEQLTEKLESHKIAEVEALYEKQINELKLTSLLSQMNPHFIFNALNSIKLYIINNEPKTAAHYLNKFSKLIRRILEASTAKETSLQDELETMDLYMTLENIRFNNEIEFDINVNEELNLNAIKVPPLVIQPFLENAIWHGLSSKKENKKIAIFIDIKNNYLKICIEDNGIGRKAAAKIKSDKSINRKSLGIELSKERLTNFVKNYNKNYSICYKDLSENEKAAGTKVVIKIPLK